MCPIAITTICAGSIPYEGQGFLATGDSKLISLCTGNNSKPCFEALIKS
jgi:hypothetical protein